MRKFLTIILILSGIAVGTPREVHADGVCTPNKVYKDSFNAAASAEKAGNPALAFVAYDSARGNFGCDGPNPFLKDAQAGWTRMGQRLAREAEARGDFYSNGGSSSTVAGPDGLQWVVWKDVAAFYWYGRIDEPAEADRVMFRFAQSKPKDYGAVTTAVTHYSGQSSDMYYAETFGEMVKQAESNPEDQQLQKRIGYIKELEKIALRNLDEALDQEERAHSRYNKREMVIGETPIEDSLHHLSVARDWHNMVFDGKANKVAERAEHRGDAMMQDERPKSFSYARQYYGLGGRSEKIKTLTAQANKLGDAAAKKGEYAPAVKYYEIGHSDSGENEDKINRLQSLLEKETKEKEQVKQKALQDMTKDDKQQKEFKKGQEDLEKELGF